MGTNALPYILGELRTADQPLRERVVSIWKRISWLAWKGRFPAWTNYTPVLLRREQAKKALVSLASDLGVATLTNLLTDPNRHVSQAAGYALARMGQREGGPYPLIAALTNKCTHVRDAAARGLAETGLLTYEAFPGLLACLADPDAELRAVAANTLGLYCDVYCQKRELDGVVSGLLRALQDKKACVRKEVVASLTFCLVPSRATIPAWPAYTDWPITNALATALRDPDLSVRETATNCLNRISRAVENLERNGR
jgi:HEAT repeat protein